MLHSTRTQTLIPNIHIPKSIWGYLINQTTLGKTMIVSEHEGWGHVQVTQGHVLHLRSSQILPYFYATRETTYVSYKMKDFFFQVILF